MEVFVSGSSVIFRAKKLVEKLEEIHADPRFKAVWTNARIHGLEYTSLSYEAELLKLKEALLLPTEFVKRDDDGDG